MNDEAGKIRLIMELRQGGIAELGVLSAVERTPRDRFVASAFREQAFDNIALPIAQGQTISQPFVVAFMTQALQVGDRMKVLEIGTGSGYQTAVLARLCRRVYTVERYRSLLRDAEARFAELRLTNVTARVGDGHNGWPEQAPFERILVTAAAPAIPATLKQQLAPGGVLVIPLERPDGQYVVRLTRGPDGDREEDLLPVRFVPLVEGVAPSGK